MNLIFKKSLTALLFSFVFVLAFFSAGSLSVEAATVTNNVRARTSTLARANPLYTPADTVIFSTTPTSNATKCTLSGGGITPISITGTPLTAGEEKDIGSAYVSATTTFTVDCEYVAPAINGVCAIPRNTCTAGIPNDLAINDDTNYYKWRCDGIDGGTNSGTCQIDKYTVTYFEWGGSTDVVNPKSYSINPTTGLPYSICDNQSGPFTNYFNLATSSTATYPGVQVYVYGTMISNPIANVANVQAAGHFAPGQGLKWLRKNGNNTIWEVNPATGVLSSGSLSCP